MANGTIEIDREDRERSARTMGHSCERQMLQPSARPLRLFYLAGSASQFAANTSGLLPGLSTAGRQPQWRTCGI
jgi:hypothetical protein